MRNLVRIALLVLLSAGVTSCEKIRSLFDVEFDSTLSGDLNIDIQEQPLKSAENYEFQSSAVVDPLDDEDIAEYIDNIKDISVNGVVAEVLAVNKENVVFKSGTTFGISDNTSQVTWTLGNDWPVTEGDQITLEDIGDIYDAVDDILNKKGQFTVSIQGVSTETGVMITIRMGIDTKVTASPL